MFRVTTHEPKKVNVKTSVKRGPLPFLPPCNILNAEYQVRDPTCLMSQIQTTA